MSTALAQKPHLSQRWQEELAQGFSNARDLLRFLELEDNLSNADAERQFKTRVPRCFAARMQKQNPHDPLLLQVLAVDAEMKWMDGFSRDPLDEVQVNPLPGLIHKYKGRVLLTLSGSCAVHCRYCFRRHFSYEDNNPGRAGWQVVVSHIKQDTSLSEVILSGGDPLLVSDKLFDALLSQLEAIPHLRTLRIHSRIPVVLPSRLTDSFINRLANTPLNVVVVIHSNHAQEWDESADSACQKLRQAGCHLLNQSVLLAGVNDNVPALVALSHRVFKAGVLPYYLHVLDKVQGAAHFDMPMDEAFALFKALQSQLPGYLVPRLAKEAPGEMSKTLLGLTSTV